jgi:hypothetical protein
MSHSYVRHVVITPVIKKCSLLWDITLSVPFISQPTFRRNMSPSSSWIEEARKETCVKQVTSRDLLVTCPMLVSRLTLNGLHGVISHRTEFCHIPVSTLPLRMVIKIKSKNLYRTTTIKSFYTSQKMI